ncbi:hypothetical protein SBA1_1380013 [Candidatus Sulfotelmatobacter kueseliae]|uniref:Uncharacterized protein n=1 Tax=Candidatus Sulfotelmatobacter kueseliae TaxID=2042962 RepID=A0A2U3K6B1_9BACT|nr:hypothetical protein SBA1_1380013 [Candidatus Sulfotelmatobacter kueseliae]
MHWALLLGGMPRSKTADALGTVRNLLNYSNPVTFLKIVTDDFRRPFSCSHSFRTFLIQAHSHDQRWPLGTPFMTVIAQRLAPNQ